MSKQKGMTPEDRSKLYACEERIEKHLATAKKADKANLYIGQDLAIIRERKLFRATHKTFEDYCTKKWGISKSYAYRLMAWAKKYEENGASGTKPPESEYEARKRRRTEELMDKANPTEGEGAADPATALADATPEEQLDQINQAEEEAVAEAAARDTEDGTKAWLDAAERHTIALRKLARQRVGTEATDYHCDAILEIFRAAA